MEFKPSHRSSYEVHSAQLNRADAPTVFITSDKFGDVGLCAVASGGLSCRMTLNAEAARLVAAELLKAVEAMTPVAEAA